MTQGEEKNTGEEETVFVILPWVYLNEYMRRVRAKRDELMRLGRKRSPSPGNSPEPKRIKNKS